MAALGTQAALDAAWDGLAKAQSAFLQSMGRAVDEERLRRAAQKVVDAQRALMETPAPTMECEYVPA